MLHFGQPKQKTTAPWHGAITTTKKNIHARLPFCPSSTPAPAPTQLSKRICGAGADERQERAARNLVKLPLLQPISKDALC
jgi:hypothetical protein